ncbi:MAG: hypothetical protein Q4C70_03080, partial [Planctomycetia bacterium]|nr:hypothetical protein [Planctomycetia bacterium]
MKNNVKHISATCLRTFRGRHFREESGILTMEWTFLIGILVVGVVGGIAVIRDALTIQYANTASALGAVNFTYEIPDFDCANTTKNDSSSVALTEIHVKGCGYTENASYTGIGAVNTGDGNFGDLTGDEIFGGTDGDSSNNSGGSDSSNN